MDIIDKEDNNTQRTINKATHETNFEEVTLFTEKFLEQCKRNPNFPQNILYERKIKISLKDGLYFHIFIIQSKTEVEQGEIFSKTKGTYHFQKQSEISKHWFDLDIECIEDNFMTI